MNPSASSWPGWCTWWAKSYGGVAVGLNQDGSRKSLIGTDVLAVPGDFGSATLTIVGEFVITAPHMGAVALEAGRVIQDVNGNIEFRARPQDFVDYYANGDIAAVQKLCDALAA
jgi:hypothetical protein